MALSRIRRGAGLWLTVLALVSVAAPSLAVTWGTLICYQSGVEQGRGYGDFRRTSDYVYAQNQANFKDSRPGGDGIYVVTDYYWGPNTTGQSPSHDETKRTTSGSYVTDFDTHALNPTYNTVRGAIKVCEDQSFALDPCSVTSIPSFNY